MDTPPPINEEEIFQVAAALPSGERAAYLDAACGDDRALRARIERLLGSHDDSVFMEGPAPEQSTEIENLMKSLKPEESGERIGPYKLLQQLGEGGFGTVWMAEQMEPVKRRVALKIIKMGMDTKEVIARFEQERQALAMMDNPNIAKVFDAGATQWGRPFFVMELVRGVPITAYCDERKLSVAERLALFIDVCHALQHAHQKGIIHRDLKPSNILVTAGDGDAPVPKIIDFGVAKAMDRTLTDKTLFTQFDQMIGTPAYMSPEQAGAGPMDIDTRSDIYSLGVLLYEMLTGRPPFDPNELRKAGHDEMRRVIREEEPPRPSTRLSTLREIDLTEIATHRHVEAAKLTSMVRGDLDWIVMKALDKNRNRRYETANGLAQDLRRHLNNEPVLACPPSSAYKVGKFIRRYKAPVAAAAAVMVALIAGLTASTVLYLREKAAWASEAEQRTKAQASAQLAEAEAKKAREQKAVAERYAAAVAAHLEGIVAKLRETLGSEHPDVRMAMSGLADSYFDSGRREEALKLRKEVLVGYRKLFGARHREVLKAMNKLADSYFDAGRRDEALKLREEVLVGYRELFGPRQPETLQAMNKLADSYFDADRREEALKLQKEALTLNRDGLGSDHPVAPAK